MERLGCWQLLGPHHASRASTHFTPPFSPRSLSLSPPFLSSASGLLCKAFQAEIVGVLSSTDVSRSYLYNLSSWPEIKIRAAAISAEKPGARLWPHLGHVPHLWNAEIHYLDLCWQLLIPQIPSDMIQAPNSCSTIDKMHNKKLKTSTGEYNNFNNMSYFNN